MYTVFLSNHSVSLRLFPTVGKKHVNNSLLTILGIILTVFLYITVV